MKLNLHAAAAAAALMIIPASSYAASMQDDPSSERATKALNLLEAKGYTQFSNFRPTGRDFEATVTRDGRQSVVMIDPDADRVSSQMASAGNGSNEGGSGSSTSPASMSGNHRGSSDKASQVYHDTYNPEGGAPPTNGVEAAKAKKH